MDRKPRQPKLLPEESSPNHIISYPGMVTIRGYFPRRCFFHFPSPLFNPYVTCEVPSASLQLPDHNGRKQALLFVQFSDCRHIFLVQNKIKHVHIRNSSHIFSNLCQDRIRKEILASLSKKSPGFMLYPIFHHIFMRLFLLLEHMGFHLVDGWFYFYKIAKVNQTVRIKV